MPSRRFARLAESERARILEAATQTFAEHGFEAANLSDIARDLDMSKSTLYYYFDNKSDLFSTAVEAWLLRILDDLGEFPEVDDTAAFWEELTAIFVRAVELTLSNELGVRLGLELARLPLQSEPMQSLVGLIVHGTVWFDRVMAIGQRVGAVRRDLPRSILVQVWLAVDQVFDRWMLDVLAHGGEVASEDAAAVGTDMFRRIVIPHGMTIPGPVPSGLPFDIGGITHGD